MNKNLKRALNTTAAVSMSLAMVLGAVAPVNAEQKPNTDYTTYVNDSYTLVAAIKDSVTLHQLQNTLPTGTLEFYGDDMEDYTALESVVSNGLGGLALATAPDTFINTAGKTPVADAFAVVSANEDKYKAEMGDDYDEEVVAFANHYLGPDGDGIEESARKLVAKYTDSTTGTGFKYWANETNFIDNDNEYKAAKDALDGVKRYAAYEHNTSVDLSKLAEDMDLVQTKLDDYLGANEDKFVSRYLKALENEKVVGALDVYDLVVRKDDVNLSNVSRIEKFIKDVKGNKIDSLKAIAKYDDVKDNSEVADYIEGLETIVEEMKEAKELIKTSNSELRAYKKQIGSKVNDLAETIKIYKDLVRTSGSSATAIATAEENLENALAQFRAEDIEAVKTYVEAVVERFYTATPVELNSGRCVIRMVDSEFGRYIADPAVNNELFTLTSTTRSGSTVGLYTVLTETVDDEKEESYYDALVEGTTTVEELLKAVTEDIEGLTFDTKITSVEANKIIKAKKALNQLLDADGNIETEYRTVLTYKEQKEVKANAELIETLYLKLILNGEVTTIGWVETPQGWEYYDNNGKRVMEGWAPGNGYWSYMKNGYSVANEWCAAKEGWYYMGADGKMVTGKVTINGVEEDFGTDGIWVRK